MTTSDLTDVRLGVDFGFGVDTKTDPKLVLKSKLLRMENARINKIGLIDKRNGTKSLANVDTSGNVIASGQAMGLLENELLELTQDKLYSFSATSGLNFTQKGAITPVGVNRRIVQSNLSNLQSVNSALVNGIALYAYDSLATNSVSWVVVDEASGTIYQTGSLAAAQTPQIVVANGKLILLVGTTTGAVVAKVFSAASPWQAPSTVTLVGITLSGTMVIGAATDGSSTIMVAGANSVGGITTATYNATTLALVTSATTTPGFAPPFISITYFPITSGGCNWGLYYPDLVGSVWVRFYGTSLGPSLSYTPLTGSATNPYGPGCMRQSPSNSDLLIVYATRYNPQGNGQAVLQAYCGQSVQGFGIRPSDGLFTAIFPANTFAYGAQLASFPWATGIGTASNILVQYQVDPTVAAQFPSGATPLSLQPTVFILDADTASVVAHGPPGQAMVASQSLSGSGSYQVLPAVSPLDPASGIYLVPDTAGTVAHVNATDLHFGTARTGPIWTENGTVPYTSGRLRPPSIGPFTTPPDTVVNGTYTLPIVNPVNFGAVSWSITVVVTIDNESLHGPVFINNTSSFDTVGWWLYYNSPGIVFGLYNPAAVGIQAGEAGFASTLVDGGDNASWTVPNNASGQFSTVGGAPIVISFGYDDTTQKMFLKVNGRPMVTGNLGAHNAATTISPTTMGNYFAASGGPPPNNPLDGQLLELWASTDSPSDSLFTSIYTSVISGLATYTNRWQIGLGASLVLESQNSEFVFAQGIGEMLLDYGIARSVFLEELAENTHITAGHLARYDGQTVAEHGFPLAPEFIQVQGNGSSLIDIEFQPPTVTQPSSLTVLTFPPGAQMYPGEWWAIDASGQVLGTGSNIAGFPTDYFWYRINGQGSDPAPLSSGGHVVDILSTDSSLQVAKKTAVIVSGNVSGNVVKNANGLSVLELQSSINSFPAGGTGLSQIPTVQSGKFRVAETVPAINGGVSTTSRCYSIACCPGAFISPSQYFTFNLGVGNGAGFSFVAYVWFKVNGVGTDPAFAAVIPGIRDANTVRTIGVEVDVLSGDTASTVATKIYTAFTLNGNVNPGLRAAAGNIPASGTNNNFVFISLLTAAGGTLPDAVVPELGANVSVGAGALGLPLGEGAHQTSSYEVVGVYAEVDGKGNIHRSAPSQPTTFVGPSSPVSDTRVVYQFPNLHLTNKGAQTILEAYRSAANGTTLYKQTPSLSPVSNQPGQLLTAITDSLQDNRDPGDMTTPELTTNEAVYTTSSLQHDPLSACSIAHVHRNRLWTAGFSDDRLRLQASLLEPKGRGIAFSNDASHLIEMTPEGGDVVTLGTLDEKLIIFKESLIYFTAGDGPNSDGQGGAFIVPERINAAVGCSAPKSVVEIDAGLMFKSTKGMMVLTRKMEAIHLEAADGFNGLTITSATKLDADEHVLFTTLEGPTLVYNYRRDAWGSDPNTGALDSLVYAPQVPGQVLSRVYYFLTSDGKVHAEKPGDYTDDGVAFSRLIQTAWIKPADEVQGSAIIREALFLGFWPSLQYETLTIEYNYGQLPASTLTFNLTGTQGVWGSSTPWGGDSVWGGSGKDITQWSARPPINKVETMRFTLQDIAPFVTDRAASIAHLDLVCGLRKGSMKLPQSQQIGS